MTGRDFRVRQEARNAIARLVRDAGGEMLTRPLIRSEPHGSTTREPEPLAGITAAVALERAARSRCLESVRYAREDGSTWAEIGRALGIEIEADDFTAARRGYVYANPGSRLADWFTWTCPSCGKLIRDYGPEPGNPHDAEQGHGEGCERFAATVAAWEEGTP